LSTCFLQYEMRTKVAPDEFCSIYLLRKRLLRKSKAQQEITISVLLLSDFIELKMPRKSKKQKIVEEMYYDAALALLEWDSSEEESDFEDVAFNLEADITMVMRVMSQTKLNQYIVIKLNIIYHLQMTGCQL
jgi:hypothetical protein